MFAWLVGRGLFDVELTSHRDANMTIRYTNLETFRRNKYENTN